MSDRPKAEKEDAYGMRGWKPRTTGRRGLGEEAVMKKGRTWWLKAVR